MLRSIGAWLLVAGCTGLDGAGEGGSGKGEDGADVGWSVELTSRQYASDGEVLQQAVVDGGALYFEPPGDLGGGYSWVQAVVSGGVSGCEGPAQGEATLLVGESDRLRMSLNGNCERGFIDSGGLLYGSVHTDLLEDFWGTPVRLEVRIGYAPDEDVTAWSTAIEVLPTPDGS